MTSTPDQSWLALLGNVDKYREDAGTDIDSKLAPLATDYSLDGLLVHSRRSANCPLIQQSQCQLISGYHHPADAEISQRTSPMADVIEAASQKSSQKDHVNRTPELCLSALQEPLHGSATGSSQKDEREARVDSRQSCAVLYGPQMLLTQDVCQKTKPKVAETTIEMSTQTERIMSDYPTQVPVPQPPPPPAVMARSNSRTSLNSAAVGEVCRICHCESEPGAPLISPCVCCGSLKYVHQACLQQWIKSADTKSCELCKFNFEMTTRIKPFRKWQKLEMTTVERRKIMCSVTFHIIAITCVIWSLYVLIDRTTEEIKMGILEWPFWTKLIVVAIGFTGGLVFMYVQCKMYVQLCRRWRAYNRVIYIQNCPNKTGQKIPLQPHMLDDHGCQKANQTSPSGVQETELL